MYGPQTYRLPRTQYLLLLTHSTCRSENDLVEPATMWTKLLIMWDRSCSVCCVKTHNMPDGTRIERTRSALQMERLTVTEMPNGLLRINTRADG